MTCINCKHKTINVLGVKFHLNKSQPSNQIKKRCYCGCDKPK